MKKSTKVLAKRPKSNREVRVAMPPALLRKIDSFATKNGTTRSEEIQRFVELGLRSKDAGLQSNERQKARAREMAGDAIDRLSDSTASTHDNVSRKKRLIKGPEEFQMSRVDRVKQ